MDVGYGKDLYIIIVCRREISERSRFMPDGMLAGWLAGDDAKRKVLSLPESRRNIIRRNESNISDLIAVGLLLLVSLSLSGPSYKFADLVNHTFTLPKPFFMFFVSFLDCCLLSPMGLRWLHSQSFSSVKC